MAFDPQVNQEITVDKIAYCFMEHPAAPGLPYGQEGRYGMVYQVRSTAPKDSRTDDRMPERCALKVFKARYRVGALAALAGRLEPFASLPGLQVCLRTVLVPQRHASLLRQYPDLTYAVLMPWIEGPTWFQIMLQKTELKPAECLAIARSLAGELSTMEQKGVAHCDLSGPNTIIQGMARGGNGSSRPTVALVDVEQLYGPGLDHPDFMPSSSPGYAHRTAAGGNWDANADRFAGAVLLAEMLGWCDERTRAEAHGESYFDPAETQEPSERYATLQAVLAQSWGDDVGQLFRRAWESETLADCPTFAEWQVALPALPAQTTPDIVEVGEEEHEDAAAAARTEEVVRPQREERPEPAPVPPVRPPVTHPTPPPAAAETIWACPRCHTENPPGTKYCLRCRAQLLRVCPECGKTASLITTGQCGECGFQFDDALRRSQIVKDSTALKGELDRADKDIAKTQKRGTRKFLVELLLFGLVAFGLLDMRGEYGILALGAALLIFLMYLPSVIARRRNRAADLKKLTDARGQTADSLRRLDVEYQDLGRKNQAA